MSFAFFTRRTLIRRSISISAKRHGYIVLVPEIGEDLPEKNPLLRDDGLPEFNKITIEKCVAVIGQQAVDVEKNVKILEETLSSIDLKNIFRDVIDPLEQISGPLETTWGLAKTLYLGNATLMPTKSYITIHDRARRARGAKFNSLPIYTAISGALAESKNFTEEQQRLLRKYQLESKLNGVETKDASRYQLNEIIDKMGQERAKFRGKVETSKKQFSQTITDPDLVKEFPSSFLQTIAMDATQPSKGPWKISLQPYIANKFLEYCPNRTLRWNLWQADTRKASGSNDTSLDNSTHLEHIRSMRGNQAKILGYSSYAEMSMETKMLGTLDNVRTMISNLLDYARPAQEEEIRNLEQYAIEQGFNAKNGLELYDMAYWKRRQLQAVFDYDEETLKEYFPIPKVVDKLLKLSENLFQIKIVERADKVDTWHEDVRYFDIFDSQDDYRAPVAGFYLDLYSREDEKLLAHENQGYVVGIRNRSSLTKTNPLAALIFNFQTPLYGKPSCLSVDDLKMLSFKFGHAFQHLLTRVEYSELSGLSNVEWDAVEISGHVMAHLLNNPKTLKSISSHYANDDQISEKQCETINNYWQHLSGYNLSRELYVAALDLELHSSKDFWLDVVKRLWPDYYVFPLDKKDAHPCSMTSIFSGEWGSAYFSHVWSNLVAADVYSAFDEVKHNDDEIRKVGKRFRETFLSLGGSVHPSEVFRRFRGRDPCNKALVSNLGLNKFVNNTLSEDENMKK